jgi:outer membrane receptor for ferrienterochelin and colicins
MGRGVLTAISFQRLQVFLAWSLCCVLSGQAQRTLNTITSEQSEAIPGVHVQLVGVTEFTGITGDLNGICAIPESWFVGSDSVQVKVSSVGHRTMNLWLKSGSGSRTVRMATDVEQLRQVVVTGQYRDSDPRKAVQRVRVITAADIDRMAATDLADVLIGEFNVRLGQDNILGASISMQGLSGENVKILIDGVPVIGRLNGNIDLSQLDLNGVQRIEVVEGPMSVNYGTNALAGTINIITRDTTGRRTGLQARTYAEHIGQADVGLSYRHQGKRGQWSVDLGRSFFTGWNPDDQGFPDLSPSPADSSRFQQWKPRLQHNLRLNYTWLAGNWSLGYKGEVMHDLILNRGYPRAPQGTTAFDEEFKTIRLDNALFAERTVAESKWNLLVAHGIYERIRNTYFKDLTTLNSVIVDAEGVQDTSRVTLTNGRFSFASTKDSAWLNWEIGTDLKYETGGGQRINEGEEQDQADLALFMSAEMELCSGVIVRPGLRVAYNSLYKAPMTPALNVRWRTSDGYTFRFSYAQGFRAPSLKELYLYFVDVNHNIIGNQNLNPETSDNLSLSLVRSDFTNGKSRELELVASYNSVRDMINLAAINATEYTYVNIGNVSTFAGRVSLQQRTEKFRYRIGAGLTGRQDRISGESIATDFYFSPEASVQTTVLIASDWSFNTQARYQGEQRNYTYVSDVELAEGILGDYFLVDFGISRRMFNERLDIAFGAKDVLDTQNIALVGGGGGAHASGADSAPLTTGRTFFLKLQLDIS